MSDMFGPAVTFGESIIRSHDHRSAGTLPIEGLLGDPMVAGRINRRVFDQDKYWWDAKGKMHVVDLMDRRYLLNVLLFCHEHHREKFDPRFSPLIRKIRKRILDA